jgi:hypothetical protein
MEAVLFHILTVFACGDEVVDWVREGGFGSRYGWNWKSKLLLLI